MQSIIKHIIEMDEQARQLTLEAQSLGLETHQNTEIKKQDIKKQYLDKAAGKIVDLESTERKIAEEKFNETKKKSEALSKELDNKYKSNKEIWAETIVKRVLNIT